MKKFNETSGFSPVKGKQEIEGKVSILRVMDRLLPKRAILEKKGEYTEAIVAVVIEAVSPA